MESTLEKIQNARKQLCEFGPTLEQVSENIKKASEQLKKEMNKRGGSFEILKNNGVIK